MTGPNRRTFLAATAALAAPAIVRAKAPREKLGVAVIGLRSRGLDLVQSFVKDEGSEVVAVCDVDDAMIARPVQAVESLGGKAPRVVKDFRRLLDDPAIGAVAIATPDHWHAIMTILACQAGKDVYVEKPASHNVIEGRRMVEAARKHDRIVQLGTQRRSGRFVRDAIDHLHSGAIGKVGLARTWHHQARPSIGKSGPGPVPAGVDYAMWQGPAPDRPFHPNRFHYSWHWFWHWGTGELGNNGIHAVDVARWGLGVDAPTRVVSSGGKYVHDDDQEVPDTQMVTWEFPGCAIAWEHKMWSKHGVDGSGFGIAFDGANGTLVIDSDGWRVVDGDKAGGPATDMQAEHVADFLRAVADRKPPAAEIEAGHLSTRLCHLGNVSHRVGRALAFDAATESFPGDDQANALLGRDYSDAFPLPTA